MSKVKCLSCGEILESKDVHDYKKCKCPNGTYIDGGDDCLRCGGKNPKMVKVLANYDFLTPQIQEVTKGWIRREKFEWVKGRYILKSDDTYTHWTLYKDEEYTTDFEIPRQSVIEAMAKVFEIIGEPLDEEYYEILNGLNAVRSDLNEVYKKYKKYMGLTQLLPRDEAFKIGVESSYFKLALDILNKIVV